MKFPKLVGKKIGMTRLFDSIGNVIVCTAIEVQKNVITQIKTPENDGYSAVQLGANLVRPSKIKNVKKPQRAFFEKNDLPAVKKLFEMKVDVSSEYTVGTEFGADAFEEGEFVDVTGTSKGKGFQGVIKRHGFAGGPASHGSSKFHRKAGSTGSRSTPGRVFPGHKMPGRMGNESVTVQNVKVVGIHGSVVLVAGSVPGVRGSFVTVKTAVKKSGGK